MTEYAGRGDPRRTMALLWDAAPAARTSGPRPALSVVDIVRAAIAVADTEGLEAVTMRHIAERLGRSPMGLYTYVPGKAELLDLMIDAVHAEIDATPTVRGDAPADAVAAPDDLPVWRAAVEAHVRDLWTFYERHPWVLRISGSRSPLGPHEFDVYEFQLRLFDRLGLSGLEQIRTVGAIVSFVRGAATAVADASAAERVTGVSDDDWWNERAPLLEALGEQWALRYPVSCRLGDEGAFDQPDRAADDTTPYLTRAELDAVAFGLQRLLDGIEAYVRTRVRRAS